MSAAERCQKWPEHERCCFSAKLGVTCAMCDRFATHAQALDALAKHRKTMLLGAEQAEETHRRRALPGLLHAAGAKLVDVEFAQALDAAHAYASERCWDVLRLQLADAVLEHGAHLLELERVWLAEWVEKWAREHGIGVAHE